MTQSKKVLLVVASLALPFVSLSTYASEFLDTKALLKETVAGNPGLELVMPWIIEVDSNLDLYPEKLKVRFRVYAAGTTNKLFQTPLKSFFPPAMPCANPGYSDWSWEPEFFGENDTYTGVALSYYAECEENGGGWNEAAGAFVYVANTAQSGSGWSASWNLPIVSVDVVDWDDDQQDEIKVVLLTENAGVEKLRVIFLDKLTGATESDVKYVGIEIID